MSREIDELRQKIGNRFTEAATTTYYGQVLEIDEELRTCTVGVGGVQYEQVLLYAVSDHELKGMVPIPRIGSTVLISRVGSMNRYCVTMASELEKVMITMGENVTAVLDEEKLEYNNDKVTVRCTDSGVEIDAEEIIFNGGSNDGLAVVEKIESNLKALENFITGDFALAIGQGINGVGPAPSANGAAGLTAFQTALGSLTPVAYTNMENPDVKH